MDERIKQAASLDVWGIVIAYVQVRYNSVYDATRTTVERLIATQNYDFVPGLLFCMEMLRRI